MGKLKLVGKMYATYEEAAKHAEKLAKRFVGKRYIVQPELFGFVVVDAGYEVGEERCKT